MFLFFLSQNLLFSSYPLISFLNYVAPFLYLLFPLSVSSVLLFCSFSNKNYCRSPFLFPPLPELVTSGPESLPFPTTTIGWFPVRFHYNFVNFFSCSKACEGIILTLLVSLCIFEIAQKMIQNLIIFSFSLFFSLLFSVTRITNFLT